MNESYAVAIVVGREAPVSSHLGDRAIVHPDGRMEGFIGGSCSRDIVRREALAALRAGEPRLVRINSEVSESGDVRDIVNTPMRCVSEGAVDVYIEPHVPRRRLLLIGFTPVAEAVAQIGPSIDYEIVRFVDEAERLEVDAYLLDDLGQFLDGLSDDVRERSAVVVATHGHYDELALAHVLRFNFEYVGLLASRARGDSVIGALAVQGIDNDRLRAVHYPAGIALGARKPSDIAVSIFAEIISLRAAHREAGEAAEMQRSTVAIDPVCGMTVELDSRHHAVVDGHDYYFCCAHCKTEFVAEPARFLSATGP